MKRIAILVVTVFSLIGFLATVSIAAEGNARKGKYTYRKVYKACHKRGAVESPRPPISPDAKTQAQWKRVFDKKDFAQFGCSDEWNNLSEKDLQNIYSYLHGHAADSPSPAKCK